MNLEKLRSQIKAEIQRIDELSTTDWMAGKGVGLVPVLQWLDEPWESDSMICRACEKGQVVPEDELWKEDEHWLCEECGAIHEVKTYRTCRLMPEGEEAK